MKKQRNRNRKNHKEQVNQETELQSVSDVAILGQKFIDTVSIKTMMTVSVLGIIGGFIGLYLLLGTGITDGYFQTKMKGNTIYASSNPNNTNTVGTTQGNDDNDGDNNTGVVDEEESDSESDDTTSLDELIDVQPTQILIDREDLIEYLDELSDKEFEVFIQTMADIIHEHTNGSDKSLSTTTSSETYIDLVTLQEAYERAEEKYPNQIDASKRISLINELNAIDYDYYVVEHGDTLGELSKALEIPMGQFIEINGIQDADRIRIGEILLVPIEE